MFVARQKHGTFEQRSFGQYQRIIDFFARYQPLFTNPLRDAFGNAMPDGDEIYGNDTPRLSKLYCLAGSLSFGFIAPQHPVRQFVLYGGWDQKASVVKPPTNYRNRVNNVIQTGREVEKYVRVNGDELWPVWSRHNRAS